MSLSLSVLAGLLAAVAGPRELPPEIPVGLDAYRQWEQWPRQRIGARAYMRSTYDRSGDNEGADASHFLYQEADDFNVTLDVEGSGILYFARYNHWHGSPWHYEVDGVDYIVQETSSADPLHPVEGSVFLPEHLFPEPLAWTWSVTRGADLMWVPIPFERSFRMAYSRTRYGTGYYIYHTYLPGARLSQPIQAWNATEPPARDVLELLRRSGEDIAPRDIPTESGTLLLESGGPAELCRLSGPGTIRALKMTVPREQALALGRARLSITWDERPEPEVDAPVCLFFGAGTLYNRDDREFLVKAFPVNIRFDDEFVHLACYFPMPFFRAARLQLSEFAGDVCELGYEIRHEPFTGLPRDASYFHATYRDHPDPKPGHDLVLLDTEGLHGAKDWSGSFVGTSFIFSHRAVLHTLEGDPRFYFDDSQSPQCYGTGTEEWGGGGDYWGGRNMTLPLAGHPVGARNHEEAKSDEDLIQSAYRFLLADLMPFGKRARITLEHGGRNQSREHYETVTFWYGLPSPSLVLTDTVDIGDTASEEAHAYRSPEASPPRTILSRYEWGPDRMNALPWRIPAPEPQDFADFVFEADANTPYYVWVRGRPLLRNNNGDASWFQFDGDIGTERASPEHSREYGFGNWCDAGQDLVYSWSSGRPEDPPITVTFDTSGTHRLRIQPRQPFHLIDQIWLSSTQEARPAPGETMPRNDGTGGNRAEIVLGASNAVHYSGGVRVVSDPGEASVREVLLVDAREFEVFPPHEEVERHTTGISEFTVKLAQDNHGVLLRRTLDYSFPNQRAEVSVADASDGPPRGDVHWVHVGTWYLAGSNTCVYSNPPGELGATQHIVQTSNRRFRDDEFLIGAEQTRGRKAIRVRVECVPVNRPLFPGHPLQVEAWSEIRYQTYCFVLPVFEP